MNVFLASNAIQHLCEGNFGRFSRFCLKLRGIFVGLHCSASETAMETIHSNLKRLPLCRSTVKCLVYCFRDTTLMPNIHGLMPLVALLFTPYAEMRCKRTLFVYVLSADHLICEDSTKSCLFSTYCLHTGRKYILLINRDRGHYREISDRGLDVLTER